LYRDITRVCEYFHKYKVPCDANAIMDRLWKRYIKKTARDEAADLSRLETESEEE
jgi:serine/threonine-protein kinase RIO1